MLTADAKRAANNARKRAWYQRNPRQVRSNSLKHNHGITIEQFEEMLDEQGNVCAICGGGPGVKHGFFHTDHDHKTGKIRGLLCQPCNLMLGGARDNPSTLVRGARYLLS